MAGVKKADAGSPGVTGWINVAYKFMTDRNDFRSMTGCPAVESEDAVGNLMVNLGLFAAGVWVARNLSDFDLMAPQPVT